AGLQERGFPESIRNGVLNWPDDYGMKNVAEFAIKSNYLFVYGTTLLLGLLPFIIFIKSLRQPHVTIRKFTAIFFLLILFSAFLFIMAVDWGRWIYIHFMMLLFLSTLLLDKKAPEIHSEPDDEYIRIPLLWPAKSSFLRRANT